MSILRRPGPSILSTARVIACCAVLTGTLAFQLGGCAAGETGPGGGGASGEGGGDGSYACDPGEKRECYSGPPGTQQGVCRSGHQSCLPDRSGWSDVCEGEVLPSPEVCATAEDENCDGQSICGGSPDWSTAWGGAGEDEAKAIACGADGNIVVVGQFEGSMEIGGQTLTSAGESDVFVVKLGGDGEVLWSRRFGDAARQWVTDVALDSNGNMYVTGYFEGQIGVPGAMATSAGSADVFVLSLTPNGTMRWLLWAGDSDVQMDAAVAVGPGDTVFVGAIFKGGISFGGSTFSSVGGWDIAVAALKDSGEHLWSKHFGGLANDYVTELAARGNSLYLVGAYESKTLNFGGGALPQGGNFDAFIARLSTSGQHVWSEGFGGDDNQGIFDVATSASGDISIIGTFEGQMEMGEIFAWNPNPDVFAAKLDADGTPLWLTKLGRDGIDLGLGIAQNDAGEVALAGDIDGYIGGYGLYTGDGGDDVFVAKLDAAGDYVWSGGFGDPSNQRANGVCYDAQGNVWAAGRFEGWVEFGEDAYGSAGETDAFVVRFSP